MDWPVLPSRGGVLGLTATSTAVAMALFSLATAVVQQPGPGSLGYAGLGALLAGVAAALGVWTAGCFTLGYRLLPAGLGIRWFGRTEIVPYAAVDGVYAGHRLGAVRYVRGVSWPGLDVGLLRTRSLGAVRLFLRTREPEAIAVVVAAGEAYAISPVRPQEFKAELIRRLEEAGDLGAPSPRARKTSRWSALMDPWLAGLAIAALALLAACLGLLAAHFPLLPPQVPISFDGAARDGAALAREDVFRVPMVGAAILLLNTGLGLALRVWDRAAAYVVLGAAVVVQLLLLVSVERAFG